MASCTDRYGRSYRCNSSWNSWGRWVALGVILVGALVFFFLCSCISARRRRKRGHQPFYGTGWAGRVPVGHGQAQYNPNYQTQQPQYNQNQNYQQPPPNYNQTSGGAAQSYFGGQRQDVEMQPPQNSYGGNHVYNAPPGPPPGKVA